MLDWSRNIIILQKDGLHNNEREYRINMQEKPFPHSTVKKQN